MLKPLCRNGFHVYYQILGIPNFIDEGVHLLKSEFPKIPKIYFEFPKQNCKFPNVKFGRPLETLAAQGVFVNSQNSQNSHVLEIHMGVYIPIF